LFADTVGLIANLPPDLVTAFRATLEEIKLADLIVVLRDVTDADVEGRAEIVEDLLGELGARDHRRLDVFNKIDLVPAFDVARYGERGFERPVAISAATGEGCEQLLAAVEEILGGEEVRVVAELPPGALLAEVYDRGRVLARGDHDGRVRIVADVSPALARRLAPYAPAEDDIS
jgi:GTP-binding protein HflX